MNNNNNNNNRRAFGDVSNVKDISRTTRDDSALAKKPALENKPVLSQPAQRPVSMSGLKGLLNNVATKPVNPAGKAQPIKVAKRNNAVFRDHLEPVAETEPSQEVPTTRSVRVHDASAVENVRITTGESDVKEEVEERKIQSSDRVQTRELDSYQRMVRASMPNSDTTISDDEEAKTAIEAAVNYRHEPEEWWEYEDEDSFNIPPLHARSDNTTGGTSTVVYPTFNPVVKRELLKAKKLVEDTRTEDEIIEDFYDSSMVAEYTSEIFFHLRSQEVSLVPW